RLGRSSLVGLRLLILLVVLLLAGGCAAGHEQGERDHAETSPVRHGRNLNRVARVYIPGERVSVRAVQAAAAAGAPAHASRVRFWTVPSARTATLSSIRTPPSSASSPTRRQSTRSATGPARSWSSSSGMK